MAIHHVQVPDGSPVFGETTSAFARFGHAPAVRANGLLFISGQIGRRPDGVPGETAEEQTELALRRLEEILRLEDLTFADLVDVTSYHVDIRENMAGFLAAKQRLVKAPHPAWTIIGVSGLAGPDLLVEIQATAAYPDRRGRR
ncbi:RidA family protein [Streptomyces thermoviolaceus]|uniref:RidA family protein n=1 Tax=Streptomyces thermoviolaceus TaxID=1952 RepID=UPI002041DE9F|nr:RidA family protein [Streptomyces thermoviolaceus]MCM3265080.1 RidA family protein [Streptomyces thermoviolaceus]